MHRVRRFLETGQEIVPHLTTRLLGELPVVVGERQGGEVVQGLRGLLGHSDAPMDQPASQVAASRA
jgi:hypothetical protein